MVPASDVCLVAGDWAELELDSRLGAGVSDKGENQTLVWLSYLRSYEACPAAAAAAAAAWALQRRAAT
jgi:hypothetical protein